MGRSSLPYFLLIFALALMGLSVMSILPLSLTGSGFEPLQPTLILIVAAMVAIVALMVMRR